MNTVRIKNHDNCFFYGVKECSWTDDNGKEILVFSLDESAPGTFDSAGNRKFVRGILIEKESGHYINPMNDVRSNLFEADLVDLSRILNG